LQIDMSASPVSSTRAWVIQERGPVRSLLATDSVHTAPSPLVDTISACPGAERSRWLRSMSWGDGIRRGHLAPTQSHTSPWARRRLAGERTALRSDERTTSCAPAPENAAPAPPECEEVCMGIPVYFVMVLKRKIQAAHLLATCEATAAQAKTLLF
jgi:hypothetical protein